MSLYNDIEAEVIARAEKTGSLRAQEPEAKAKRRFPEDAARNAEMDSHLRGYTPGGKSRLGSLKSSDEALEKLRPVTVASAGRSRFFDDDGAGLLERDKDGNYVSVQAPPNPDNEFRKVYSHE